MSPFLIYSSASKPRAFLWPPRLYAICSDAMSPSSLLQPHWLLSSVLTHMQHTSTSDLCTDGFLCTECSSPDICMAHSLTFFKSFFNGCLSLRSLQPPYVKWQPSLTPLSPPISALCFPIALVAFEHSVSLNCLLRSLFAVCFLQVGYKLQKGTLSRCFHYCILSFQTRAGHPAGTRYMLNFFSYKEARCTHTDRENIYVSDGLLTQSIKQFSNVFV